MSFNQLAKGSLLIVIAIAWYGMGQRPLWTETWPSYALLDCGYLCRLVYKAKVFDGDSMILMAVLGPQGFPQVVLDAADLSAEVQGVHLVVDLLVDLLPLPA